jgi:hypothetical protein
MKVKTFTEIVTILFLLVLIAIVQFSQYIKADTSSVAATERPYDKYSASTTMPDETIPEVNETPVNLMPVNLSENSQVNIKITTMPSRSGEPVPTSMAPMKPMEPWEPTAPMTPW